MHAFAGDSKLVESLFGVGSMIGFMVSALISNTSAYIRARAIAFTVHIVDC